MAGGDLVRQRFSGDQLLDEANPNLAGLAANRRTGALLDAAAPRAEAHAPAGQWNRVRIRMEGNRVQAGINDVKVLEHDGAFRPRAHIGLQLFPTRVQFRNIRIRNLSSDVVTTRAARTAEP